MCTTAPLQTYADSYVKIAEVEIRTKRQKRHVNEHLGTGEWEGVAFHERRNEWEMVMNIYSMQVISAKRSN